MPEWDHFEFLLFYDFHLILILIEENGLGLYASAYHEGAFYTFFYTYYGDYNEDKVLGEIGCCDTDMELAGLNWNEPEVVVFDGTQFLVLGGYGYQEEKFEIGHCVVNGTKITCSEQHLLRGYYYDYPKLMLVDDNYGKDC